MCSLFMQATSREPAPPETRAHPRIREWLVRNRYAFPIIGLAFYYTGFALISGSELFLIVLLLSIPLLIGLAVRRSFIVIPAAALIFVGSLRYNLTHQLYDNFGLGWALAGDYIDLSGYLFILTVAAWIISSRRVTT